MPVRHPGQSLLSGWSWSRAMRFAAALVSLIAGLAGPGVAPAHAQVPDVPVDAQSQFGPLFYSPGLVFSSGYDTNPWRETGAGAVYNTFETYVTPQVATWMKLGHLRLDGFTAVEVVKAGEAVASKNHQYGSNVVWNGSILEPYLQWTSKHTNANPTGFEVGRKSMRNENDLKGGATLRLGSTLRLFGFTRRTKTAWDADALYQTSSLREKLNRTDIGMGGGFELALTPLTSVRFSAEQNSSSFVYSPIRNGSGSRLGAGISMSGPGLLSGNAEFGMRQFQSATSGVQFRGMFGNASINRTFSTDTSVGVRFERDLQFSYDNNLAYFVGQSLELTVIQPLGESMATQFTAGRHSLAYDRAAPDAVPTNGVAELNFVLGRKVRRRTWIGTSIEWARARGNEPWDQKRVIGFLTFGSGPFQRLDRPIPFSH